jgi:hypothetical protein
VVNNQVASDRAGAICAPKRAVHLSTAAAREPWLTFLLSYQGLFSGKSPAGHTGIDPHRGRESRMLAEIDRDIAGRRTELGR